MSQLFQQRFTRSVFLALVALTLGLLPLGQRISAQGGLATVNGTVYDTSGAVVPSAQVTLTNQSSGELRQAKTNGSGVFNFPGVPQGLYSVSVTKTGFTAFTKTNIAVNASSDIKVTGLTLKPGSMTQSISVRGNAYYAVPLNSGAKQNVLTSQQIQNTLVETRDAVELLKILPGVVNFGYNAAGASGYGSGVGNNTFIINGTRGDTIQESFDGADNIDPGNYGGNAAMPDVDMVSQVTVQTSNFSASNPKGPTVISAVTKGGGSAYHGEAYYSTRLSQFNANDWLANANGSTRPASKFYYPGFNIGGPVIIPGTSFNKHHDKMFFWAGFEYMKQNQDTGFNQTVVPTAAMRQGDFTNDPWAGVCPNCVNGAYPTSWNVSPGTFWSQNQPGCAQGNENYQTPVQPSCLGPGLMNPKAFDPGGVALMNMVPLPNADPALHHGNNYIGDVLAPTNHKTFRARVDYDFSPNTKLYAVLDRDSEFAYMPYGLWWGGSNVPYPGNEDGLDHSYQLSGTLLTTLSPTLTNTVQVGTTRIVFNDDLQDPSKATLAGTGYTYNGIYKNTLGYVPSFMSWGGGFPNMLDAQGNPGPNSFAWKWLNDVRDDLSKVAGSHVLKFGVYFEHVTNEQPVGDTRGTAQLGWGGCDACSWDQTDTNNAVSDLLIGHIGGWNQTNVTLDGKTYDNELDFYGQDSWKATPQLTLNYGARVYYSPFMEESLGRESVFVPTAYQGPTCFNPGIMGCGTSKTLQNDGLQNAFGGGTAPESSFTGLESHHYNPNISMGGFPSPGIQVAPNVGFAYDLTGKGNTVIRGGFGLYYYRDEGNFFFNSISNPPYLLNSSPASAHTLLEANNPNNLAGVGRVNLTVLDPYNSHIPETESYSLTWSQRIGFRTVLEASYVGNSSYHQDTPGGGGNGGTDFNLVPQGAELQYELTCLSPNAPSAYNCSNHDDNWWRPYQNYGSIDWLTHSLSQNYNAFQVSLTRTSGRLSYAANYTFGKALGESGIFNSNGNVVDPYDARGRSYGPLPYDHTQVVNVTYSILLPDFGKNWFGGNAIADGFLNGWQLSGISSIESGAPWTFGNGQNGQARGFSQVSCPKSGVMPSGYSCVSSVPYSVSFTPDVIAGTPDTTVNMFVVCNPTTGLQPQQFYNAQCFQSPSPGQNGDYQLPYIHQPSFMSNDLGIFKNFALGKSESQKIQVRIEGFNFLNHANWTTGGEPGIQFAGYGQHPYSIRPVSTGGIAPGYLTQKVGNRVMEFEVKYIF